jgi:NitT/TauT family transport system permease protein
MKFAPALFGVLALLVWEAAVRIGGVPSYLVPGPVAIVAAFLADPAGLLLSLGSTLLVTFAALLVAASLGVVLAVAIASSRLLAAAIQPWTIVLQVTPIVAIAPLIIVWVGDPFTSLVGAVVAEFVAGSGGFASGLAYRILEAGYRLQVPRMFAALVLLSLAGIAINFGLGAFAALMMRRRGGA